MKNDQHGLQLKGKLWREINLIQIESMSRCSRSQLAAWFSWLLGIDWDESLLFNSALYLLAKLDPVYKDFGVGWDNRKNWVKALFCSEQIDLNQGICIYDLTYLIDLSKAIMTLVLQKVRTSSFKSHSCYTTPASIGQQILVKKNPNNSFLLHKVISTAPPPPTFRNSGDGRRAWSEFRLDCI